MAPRDRKNGSTGADTTRRNMIGLAGAVAATVVAGCAQVGGTEKVATLSQPLGDSLYEDIDALRGVSGMTPSTPPQHVYVVAHTKDTSDPSGNTRLTDGGGGHFVWDGTETADDNDGTIVRPHDVDPSAPGRWVRLYNEQDAVSVKWFGAKGDGIADDYNPIQRAIDFVSQIGLGTKIAGPGDNLGSLATVWFPPGVYLITYPLIIEDQDGWIGTRICLAGTPSGSTFSIDRRTYIKYAGTESTDFAIMVHSRDCVIKHLGIECDKTTSLTCAIDIDNSTQPGANVCQNNHFEAIQVQGYRENASGAISGDIQHAFRIGHGGGTNCDTNEFRDCHATAITGNFLFIDNSTGQSILNRVVNCSVYRTVNATGVRAQTSFIRTLSGSYSARNCSCKGSTDADFVVEQQGQRFAISIDDHSSEAANRLLRTELGTHRTASPISIRGGRISSAQMTAGEFISVDGLGALILDGVEFLGANQKSTIDSTQFRIKATHSKSQIIARGCSFPYESPFDVTGNLYVQGCICATYTAPDYVTVTGWELMADVP